MQRTLSLTDLNMPIPRGMPGRVRVSIYLSLRDRQSSAKMLQKSMFTTLDLLTLQCNSGQNGLGVQPEYSRAIAY